MDGAIGTGTPGDKDAALEEQDAQATGNEPTPTGLDGEVSRSGTRIRRIVYDAGDGAAVTLNMHDLDMEVDCAFRRFADGSYRCVPLHEDARFYRDASCTLPIVFVYDACPAARQRYMSHGVASPACGEDPQYETYAISADPAQGVSAHYYSLAPAGCIEIPNDRTEGAFHDLEAVEAERWAEATVMTFKRGASAEVEVYVSSDGAREVRRVIDVANGWSCLPEARSRNAGVGPSIVSDARCVPAETAVGNDAFGDTACTEPAASYFLCNPGVASAGAPDLCTPAALFRLGDAYPPGPYSAHVGSECTTFDSVADMLTLHRRGASIARDELPVIELASQGSGALRALVPTIAGGAIGPALAFTDATGQRCEVARFVSGEYRCLPTTVRSGSRRYADAACSASQLVLTGPVDPDCGDAQLTHAAFGTNVDCIGLELETVHELGDPFTGTTVYAKAVGFDLCSAVPLNGTAAFELGPAIAVDVFPEVTLGVEP